MKYYKPSSKEIESVLKLDFEKRLKYFKNIVGDKQQICFCKDEDGNLFAGYDVENRECISVWPAKEFAEILLTQTKLRAFNAVKYLNIMEIHDFLKEYIKELIEFNINVLVFPTESGGTLFEAKDFYNMIIDELLKYEDYDELKEMIENN